jgi:hypothetical protein
MIAKGSNRRGPIRLTVFGNHILSGSYLFVREVLQQKRVLQASMGCILSLHIIAYSILPLRNILFPSRGAGLLPYRGRFIATHRRFIARGAEG